MKILYAAHKPPVPNKDGGTFAMRQFADVLSETASIDAFIISTQKHPYSRETEDYLRLRFDHFEFEEIDTRTKILPFLLSLFLRRSYILERFQSEKLRTFIHIGNYDLIICDSLSSLFAVNKALDKKPMRLWLRSHNVEFAIWQSVAKQKGFFSKSLYNLQATILRKKETELIRKTELNLCISLDDLNTFQKLVPDTKHTLLPIHVSINPSIQSKEKDCYFIGSDNWEPNIETVDYLIACWKKPEFASHSLRIAGGFDRRYSPDSQSENIEIVGRVESAEEFALKNGILVAPAFSGSGIRVKLLEALALGVPCITTKIGAQGISDEAGLIVVNDEKELLKAITKLKSDNEYFSTISNQGKSYIQKKHSFAAIKQIIVDALGE